MYWDWVAPYIIVFLYFETELGAMLQISCKLIHSGQFMFASSSCVLSESWAVYCYFPVTLLQMSSVMCPEYSSNDKLFHKQRKQAVILGSSTCQKKSDIKWIMSVLYLRLAGYNKKRHYQMKVGKWKWTELKARNCYKLNITNIQTSHPKDRPNQCDTISATRLEFEVTKTNNITLTIGLGTDLKELEKTELLPFLYSENLSPGLYQKLVGVFNIARCDVIFSLLNSCLLCHCHTNWSIENYWY